jgi:uncharacterized repeat protein (TIGR01451 family)
LNTRILRLVSLSLIILSLSLFWADHIASADSPVLNISMSVSDEPLLGGQVGYKITVKNTGAVPVEDKGYNLTLTNTLPISINFVSANPAPTFISRQANGETLVIWNNIADLEVNETLDVDLVASLDSGLSVANTFINNIQAIANKVPDNSGNWVSANAQIIAKPQAIDIEMVAHQSTGDEQATGAGEYDASAPGRGSGPDWLYQYELTIKNNNAGNSTGVVATAILPPGVAYLGQPTIFPNPNNSPVTPTLALKSDGALELRWSLGTLSTGQHNAPINIQFDAAIPYKYRTVSNNLADDGPFAGPMKGAIIPEDTVMLVGYEATTTYQNVPTADGSQSTPDDDAPIKVTAEYATVSKSASPKVVGIGSTVTFNLNYYISEYYTATNVILTDVLPDGMTYQEGSASLEPAQINVNTPGPGQTTLVWNIPAGNTTPGKSGTVIFRATVDPSYEASPYTGQPVVSGDSLTNQVNLNSDWQDAVSVGRSGNGIPDNSKAAVTTRMPLFLKQVWNEVSQSWVQFATGFTGDTMRFRLVFDAAADVDAKGVIIRDFLPRGMTYVSGSAVHTQSGSFSNGLDCNTAPTSPIVDTLNGLQFVEWRLCNVSQGSHWEVTIDAIVSDIPQVQPGWLVANFGKLSGHNTPGAAYSLRDTANVDYIAPELLLTKTATPGSNLVAGDGVVYTISVTNQGRVSASRRFAHPTRRSAWAR